MSNKKKKKKRKRKEERVKERERERELHRSWGNYLRVSNQQIYREKFAAISFFLTGRRDWNT